ncbi:dihydrodipicolinate synthase family protein [Sneathiella sp.]|jgi:4-hydroxy-tetrahydrodipicolinate synthase|uniref:dihydrodipicolinate synthase family protein n=1 Tax=Sneathiella sp. TaxID=1964365 RepID=UPI0025CF7809|nr:dihydrodipicolinate synthase family protein [Sneathiella sp.]
MADQEKDDKSDLAGVIAAVPTPVTRAGHLAGERFLRQCEWALENGCDGLNILGTTGEANSFGQQARRDIMEAAADALPGRKLMVGTGTPDLETTISLTHHAADLGYAAALVLPPFYYKPVSDEGLFRYFMSLCDVTSDSPIPIYLYNYPALTGVPFSLDLIRRLWTETEGRICGIKDSSGDIPYCREIVKALPEFRVFPSSETSLAAASEHGFAGCISATANISAPICARLWTPEEEKPDAADVAELTRLRAAITAAPLIPAIKHLIARRFAEEEWERVLPPLTELTEDEKNRLKGISLSE